MTSPQDVLINGLTYVENLIRVPKVIDLGDLSGELITTYLTNLPPDGPGLTTGELNSFMGSYNSATNPLPSSYASFTSALINYAASLGKTVDQNEIDFRMLVYYLLWTNSDANTPAIFGLFNISVSGSTDWDIIDPIPSQADLTAQMKAFFTDFLQNYPYSSGSAGTFNDFFEKSSTSLAITAFLQTDSFLNAPTITKPDTPIIPRYDKIYSTLFPNAPAGAFAARLNQFYDEQIAERGFFVPSIALGDWTTAMITEFSRTLDGGPLSPTSLSSSNFDKTLILDRIFVLISSLVGTLQNIAAVQANRLVLLSNWQQAYTNSLSQLHTFLQTDGTFIANQPSGDNNARAYVRGQANDKVNSSLRELLQSNRSIVGDNAKALQSNVNQTNDAVSQQANAAQAILQELTTLLGAIFR